MDQPRRPANPFDVEAREYLGTPRSEEAVRRGLDYLANRQRPEGNWGSGRYNADTAITGFGLLAYLAAGHQPGRGKYGEKLTKAADWLLDSVRRNGLVFSTEGSAGPPMYDHGFATLALAELYGMTNRADLRPKLESAIRLIVASQNAQGAWRYQPSSTDSDISVAAAQVVALRAAHNAGIKVPEDTVKRAVVYMKSLANNPDGGFSYQHSRPGSGPARTGAAITALMLAGEKNSPECQGGIKYLIDTPLDRNEYAYRRWYHYALYYCTQAMYQVGGQPWKDWFTTVRERLISTQSTEGNWNDQPGPEYATATAILALQVPAGLLPIYQK